MSHRFRAAARWIASWKYEHAYRWQIGIAFWHGFPLFPLFHFEWIIRPRIFQSDEPISEADRKALTNVGISWLATITAIVIFLLMASYANAEPCFPSKEALKAALPHVSHYSWTYRDGPTRYYAGYPNKHVRCDEPTERSTDAEIHSLDLRCHNGMGCRKPAVSPDLRLARHPGVGVPDRSRSVRHDVDGDRHPDEGARLEQEIWSWPDMKPAPDRNSLYEQGKVLLAAAMKEAAQARAAKVAEWRR